MSHDFLSIALVWKIMGNNSSINEVSSHEDIRKTDFDVLRTIGLSNTDTVNNELLTVHTALN